MLVRKLAGNMLCGRGRCRAASIGGDMSSQGSRRGASIICWMIGSALALGLVVSASSAQAQNAPKVPDNNQLVLLIRNAIVALNNANQTGNYTVLRDLGAPGFQRANTAAQLSLIFTDLRERRLNLAAVVLLTPKLTEKPALTEQGLLRLKGFFPTQPQLVFEMLFQQLQSKWLVFGLSVNVAKGNTQQSGAAPDPEAREGQSQDEARAVSEPGATTDRAAFVPVPADVPAPKRRPSVAEADQPASSEAGEADPDDSANDSVWSSPDNWPF